MSFLVEIEEKKYLETGTDGKSMDWRFLGFTITKTKQVDIAPLFLLRHLLFLQRYIFVRLTKCRTLRLVTFLQGSTMHCVFLILFTLLFLGFFIPFSTKPSSYRAQHQCTASTLSTRQYHLLKYTQLCLCREIICNCFKMLCLSYFSH